MIGIFAQLFSIVFLHDFNPALTPGLMEDDASLDMAYALMELIHG